MKDYSISIARNDRQEIDIVKIYAQQKREAEKFIRKVYRSRAVRIVKVADEKGQNTTGIRLGAG
jgi:hypothetical protein